jgi:hypothetical protein
MFALYWSRAYPQHWFVRANSGDWMMFPAKADGWKEARYLAVGPPAGIVSVPLWLAFGTGLPEAARRKKRRTAA